VFSSISKCRAQVTPAKRGESKKVETPEENQDQATAEQ
jgi:hypothetical protein